MGFEWDPGERSAFDQALTDHLAAQFPGVAFEWLEDNRRLMVSFPDGAVCTLWEPNFFFSFPSFTLEHLFSQASAAIAAQHESLLAQLTNEH
jgi:hypothetical protein